LNFLVSRLKDLDQEQQLIREKISLATDQIREALKQREDELIKESEQDLPALKKEIEGLVEDHEFLLESMDIACSFGEFLADGSSPEVGMSRKMTLDRLNTLISMKETRIAAHQLPLEFFEFRLKDLLTSIQLFGKLRHVATGPIKPALRDYKEIKEPTMVFGSEGSGDGKTYNPFDVAIDRDGNIIDVENNNHRVQVFDSSGKFLYNFGENGHNEGEFNYPWGICFDSERNRILVSDSSNNRIQLFDVKGKHLATWTAGEEGKQLGHPVGITIDSQGNVYTAEKEAGRVAIFTPEGNLIRQFGNLKNPLGIGVLSDGRIVVSELRNQIIMFNQEGETIRVIGKGELSSPYHIYVDPCDQILVCDADNKRVVVYDEEGTKVTTFGESVLTRPYGIAADQDGRVIIADFKGHQIFVF